MVDLRPHLHPHPLHPSPLASSTTPHHPLLEGCHSMGVREPLSRSTTVHKGTPEALARYAQAFTLLQLSYCNKRHHYDTRQHRLACQRWHTAACHHKLWHAMSELCFLVLMLQSLSVIPSWFVKTGLAVRMYVACMWNAVFIHILHLQSPAVWPFYPMLCKVLVCLLHLTKHTLSLTAGAVFIPSATPATSPDARVPGPSPGPAAAALHEPPFQLPFPSPAGTARACQACAYWK